MQKLQLLGGITPAQVLRDYWHKKPLLIRNAIPGFQPLLPLGDLASLAIKTHYDMRAARILLARQTYMMREMGAARGELHEPEPEVDRRAGD